MGQLSDAEKRIATVNGVLRESAPMLGDAGKYSATAAGQVARFSNQLFLLKVALGNAFLPILTTVLPLLTAFINGIAVVISWIGSLISFISSLFKGFSKATSGGAKGFSKAATGVKSIGENAGVSNANVQKLGGSAGGASKNLGSAAKAAKALKKELSGFDEINILNKPNESLNSGGGSGGGGGGGGGGSIDIPEIDTGIPEQVDAVNKKVGELHEKFKKIIGPLKVIAVILGSWLLASKLTDMFVNNAGWGNFLRIVGRIGLALGKMGGNLLAIFTDISAPIAIAVAAVVIFIAIIKDL